MRVYLATTTDLIEVNIDDDFAPAFASDLQMTSQNIRLLTKLWDTCETTVATEANGRLRAIYSDRGNIVMSDWD